MFLNHLNQNYFKFSKNCFIKSILLFFLIAIALLNYNPDFQLTHWNGILEEIP